MVGYVWLMLMALVFGGLLFVKRNTLTFSTSSTATQKAWSPSCCRLPHPFLGKVRPIPGKIEAEHFDEGEQGAGFVDTTPQNLGAQYRNTAVDLFVASDPQTPRGVVVDAMETGEWLNYTVKVMTTRDYIPTLRIKPSGRVGVRLELDAKSVAQTTVVGSSWANVKLPRLQLVAGFHQLRLRVDSGKMAFNWMKVE